jgi:hypothetical protein
MRIGPIVAIARRVEFAEAPSVCQAGRVSSNVLAALQ